MLNNNMFSTTHAPDFEISTRSYDDILLRNNQLVQEFKKEPSAATLAAVFRDEQASIVVLLNFLVSQYMLTPNRFWYTKMIDNIARICFELSDITFEPKLAQQVNHTTGLLEQLGSTIRLFVQTYYPHNAQFNDETKGSEQSDSGQIRSPALRQLEPVSAQQIKDSADRFSSVLKAAGFNSLADNIHKWFSGWLVTIASLPAKIANALPNYLTGSIRYVGALFQKGKISNATPAAASVTNDGVSAAPETDALEATPAINEKAGNPMSSDPDPRAHLAELMVYVVTFNSKLEQILSAQMVLNNITCSS